MRLKQILGLLTIIPFLLFSLFKCDPEPNNGNDTEKAGFRINCIDIESGEHIRDPIIQNGKLGEYGTIEIPEVPGYLALFEGSLEEVPYQMPIIDCDILYVRLQRVGPDQGLVIIKYVNDQGFFVHFEQIVGTIGDSQSYTHDFPDEAYQVVNEEQETIMLEFSGELQVIKVEVAPVVHVDKFWYTVKYLEESSNKVLHEELRGVYPKGETLDLESHPVIPGYKVQTEQTKIVIKDAPDANVLNVYYVKDETQWVTLTFSIGENATKVGWTQETYEVIKNHPLNGRNQPSIKVPEFEANLGYKINPDGKWSEQFDPEDIMTRDKTIYAQVVIDEDQKFGYTVYYRENREHGGELADRLTGTHHLGTIELPEHPVIPGFTLETEEREYEIKNHEYYNRITIYYVKDLTQWVTIQFKPRHCTLHGVGAPEYEVIKDWPLNGRNQPDIKILTISNIDRGYKKANQLDEWVPSFDRYGKVLDDTIYYANVVVDPSQTFYYEIYYLEQDAGYKKVRETVEGFHHVGELDIGNPPTVHGYNVVGTPPTTLEISAYSPNKLTIYYEKIVDDWVTVRFSGGDHGVVLGDNQTYDILKAFPLNSPNQPKKVLAPAVEGYPGYKHNPNHPWEPAFSSSMQVLENTVFVARYVADPNVKFDYQINYLEENTNRVLLTAKRGKHHIGTLQLDPHPTLSGYHPSTTPAVIEITDDTSKNILNVYYSKDPSQWTTVTFASGENSTVTETQFEVIKGIPFHMPIQLPITPPEITAHFGYEVDSNDCWSPVFSPEGQTSEPITYRSKVVFDSERYTTVTFLPGDNATLEGVTQFAVLKNHPFNGENQGVTVTPPQVIPKLGYKNNLAGDWIGGFDASTSTSIPVTYTAQVDIEPSEWREITINHLGADFTGNFTVVLETDNVSGIISINYDTPEKSFTGYTFDPTNAATYKVNEGDSQVVEVRYTRNKHTISFQSGVDINPNPMNDVSYGSELLDVLVLDQTPLKTGYHIEGWTIGDTGVLIKDGDTMPDNDILLKARWKANTYLILFNPNCHHSEYTGVVYDLVATYDKSISLRKNEYEREGYEFLGWAIEPTGGVKYNDEQQVINLATSGEFKLYAVWNRLNKITLYLNGGSLPEGSDEVIIYLRDEDMSYKSPYYLPIPTKPNIPAQGIEFYGFEFAGYYTENIIVGPPTEKLMVAKDYTFHATWYKYYHESYYPQSKVTDPDLITILNQQEMEWKSATITSRGGQTYTEEWNVITYNEERYEKVGDDFYKYEPIVHYLTEDGVHYFKHIIDFAPFDSGGNNTNTYHNSYLFHYMKEVFDSKTGYSTPKLFIKERLENSVSFPDSWGRRAQPTDYARAVAEGKRSEIPWANYEGTDPRAYWTKTKATAPYNEDDVYYVWWVGDFEGAPTNCILGIRPGGAFMDP
ncbi:MAG: InlB B-repeat-containing protein [Acholeplasmataceae bacterium]|jgi:uncharacterized repeat protein (TIGR02543 family)